MTSRGDEALGAGDLFAAIAAGDIDRVRAILEARPGLAAARTEAGMTALLDARYRSRADIVEVLLAAGPELDVFEAAATGRSARLAELVAADPSLVNSWSVDGFTPLHLAAFFGHETAVRLLLSSGADPGAVSRNPMIVMPLHSATAGRQAAAVAALLEGGAPVDGRTHGGYTPLMEAVANGAGAIVRILVEAGADPEIRNDEGANAFDLAATSSKPELEALLRLDRSPEPGT